MDTSFLKNEGNDCGNDSRGELLEAINLRNVSLTNAEKTFLSGLLLDKPGASDDKSHNERLASATDVLRDESLFSIPAGGLGEFYEKEKIENEPKEGCNDKTTEKERDRNGDPKASPSRPRLNKYTRSNRSQRDLWKAHSDGMTPTPKGWEKLQKSLIRRRQEDSDDLEDAKQKRRSSAVGLTAKGFSSNNVVKDSTNVIKKEAAGEKLDEFIFNRRISANRLVNAKPAADADLGSVDAQSDSEVGFRDDDTHSSWNSSQGGFDHYDAWEVIRDEYAEDFGFNVAVAEDESQSNKLNQRSKSIARFLDEDSRGIFKILGTSAEDKSAMPHVLSPPLMNSLLDHVPERLQHQNFWLKFSLIRDGANIGTLQQYSRASTHTILAIETTDGDVIGSFTSSPWRNNGNSYFGTGESFLWRMKNNRKTPVHSLFEQAVLESEIEMFRYNGSNDYVQLCSWSKLVLGGGSISEDPAQNSVRNSSTFGGSSFINGPSGDDFANSLAMDGESCFDRKEFGFGLVVDEHLLKGSTSPCPTFGNPSLIKKSNSSELFDIVNLEVWAFTAAEFLQDAEQTEMSSFFVREMSKRSSNRSSNRSEFSSFTTSSRLSTMSTNDFPSESFYRRLGE